jgi:ABC-2 type transport system ATP-binding protein
MKKVLQVKNLVKSYAGKEVLHEISFEVEEGEIFALLGSNGAGKTTTLECMEGLRRYDKGEILFFNQDKEKQNIHKQIGIQLQSTALPANITVVEAYKLFCIANKVKIDFTLLERFGLDKILNKQYLAMSTGQKRRLHLALSLVHNPRIIFLDEPTAGLDVEGQVALHEEIRHLKEKGKTVILASHNMAEVEKLCDRIAILRDGQVGFIGKPEDLVHSYEVSIEIAIKTKLGYQNDELEYSKFIKNDNGYDCYQTNAVSEAMFELLQKKKLQDNKVIDMKINHSSLEDKFMEFSKEEAV